MKHKSNKNNENKTKKVFEKVVNYVQTIVENGEYEKFLKFQKSFKGYSFNNLILIFSQFPDATRVAGKSKWLKLKRKLVPGAQKIFIIAPIPRQYSKKVKKVEDGEEIETIETYKYNYYRYVYVYDISQTTGEEIPLENHNINSNDMASFYEKLKSFSQFTVYEKDLYGSMKGYYNPSKKEIVIKKSLSINDKSAVLLHELAHGLYDDFDYKTNRNLSEVLVESIAYIVADHFGLDTSLCSFNYITKWAKGDSKIVLELGSKIQKYANQFIKNIEEFEMQTVELVA